MNIYETAFGALKCRSQLKQRKRFPFHPKSHWTFHSDRKTINKRSMKLAAKKRRTDWEREMKKKYFFLLTVSAEKLRQFRFRPCDKVPALKSLFDGLVITQDNDRFATHLEGQNFSENFWVVEQKKVELLLDQGDDADDWEAGGTRRQLQGLPETPESDQDCEYEAEEEAGVHQERSCQHCRERREGTLEVVRDDRHCKVLVFSQNFL